MRTKDSVELYDPRTDCIKCAKLEQEVLSKVQKDWKVFFMNERAQYDKVCMGYFSLPRKSMAHAKEV